MSKQRFINTKFWDDDWIVELNANQKLVYLYLITNPLTTIAGSYEVSVRRIAFDTALSPAIVKDSLSRFEAAGKIVYRNGWLLLGNFIKHQSNNPKVLKGIEVAVSNSPDWVKDTLSKGMDSLSKPTIYSDSDSDSDSDSNNQEKEEEGKPTPPAKRPKGLCEIPPDFSAPQKEIEKLAAECPTVAIGLETANFIDHYLGNGEKGKDWLARWRKWIRTQHKWNLERQAQNPQSATAKKNTTDMLSPDYVSEADHTPFEIAVFGADVVQKGMTPEYYQEFRAEWSRNNPKYLHEVTEYEHGREFRERFSEAGQGAVSPSVAASGGNGHRPQAALPVPRG